MINKLPNILRSKNKYLQGLSGLLILISLSIFIMLLTFIFACPDWNPQMPIFKSYFDCEILLFMNFIPIFLWMAAIYLLSNKLWIGFITSISFVALSIVNMFKLTYRDDPFTFIDLRYLKESLEMTNRYEIKLTPGIVIILLGLLTLTILLKRIKNYEIQRSKIRFSLLFAVVFLGFLLFHGPYFNYEVYYNVGDKEVINIWSKHQQFQSKGFVYPFIYSIKHLKEVPPENYDKPKAIEDLNKFDYADIPDDQKVNFIAVMLESFNDFSKFEAVDFGINPYENFHKIQEKSIHGKLVNNIFAGETIQTERSFLTGYNNHPAYFRKTNSFIWYFQEQDYRTEAMHPIYGWFYNRRNVNKLLGFDSFDYYENKYQEIQIDFLNDQDFFDHIIDGYENSKRNHQPYFNFTVTYQNHGPYPEESFSNYEFLKKKEDYNHYDESTYNIINNYLEGIRYTDIAIKKLVDYFDQEEEPTILVFFGDHNPWLGIDGYDMLGIDLDFATPEGFLNYYSTPYILWGNYSANTALNRELVGRGKDISPNLLMAEIFEHLGWEGNEYMQYLQEYKKHIQVNNPAYFREGESYTTNLSHQNQQRYEDFLNVEYYYSHHFKR